MIAALPMYDWPETRGHNDVLWARIAAELTAAHIESPLVLTRGQDLIQLWLSPDLLLAQTCSYPLETVLKGKVKYVATPTYAAEGCEKPGHYRSVILVRGNGENAPVPDNGAAALPNWQSQTRFAFNSIDSMSGYHGLKRDLAADQRGLPIHTVETGSHRGSIIAVADHTADLCCVDCVSWAMALEFEPAAQKLKIAGWTKERPGLPLITAFNTSPRTIETLAKTAQSVLGAIILASPTDFKG